MSYAFFRASAPKLVCLALGLFWLAPQTCRSSETPALPGADKYLSAVQRMADVVLEKGTDRYGSTHTRLFVDGLHVQTLEPVRWKLRGEEWVLCNFASQQALLRTLDALTVLTGDKRYRRAAEGAIADVFRFGQSPNGLLYSGGHAALDLQTEKPVGQYPDVHEVKNHQPAFDMMWRVNPKATHALLEGLWSAHVVDWEMLDYNRHGSLKNGRKPAWDAPFKETVRVPFASVANNLSFALVTPSLLHSGVGLVCLTGDKDALKWTRRLAYRWQQARDPKTGLSGGQLSYRAKDRAQEALGHIYTNINEAKIVATYHQSTRYHTLPLAQMQAGLRLRTAGSEAAKVGGEFIRWASEDLDAYARYSYDRTNRVLRTMMTDGTFLDWTKAKAGYYDSSSFAPRKPDGMLLWSYALAYRLTKDNAHWAMVRELCKDLGFGEIGTANSTDRKLAVDPASESWSSLYAFLELHRVTGDPDILRLACAIGDRLLELQAPSGIFHAKGASYGRTGEDIELALLHLAARLRNESGKLPEPILDNRFFHCEFDGWAKGRMAELGDLRTYDKEVFYRGGDD